MKEYSYLKIALELMLLELEEATCEIDWTGRIEGQA